MLLASFMGTLLGVSISVLSIFLIMIVLIQRGRGGGLTGALGGLGGQSAFGARAGDKIMWMTAGLACVWILLCSVALWTLGNGGKNNTIGGSLPASVNLPPPPGAGNAAGGIGQLPGTDAALPAGTAEGDKPAETTSEASGDSAKPADTAPATTPPADAPPSDKPAAENANPATPNP